MDGFSVGKILAGLRNPELYLQKLKQAAGNESTGTAGGFSSSLTNAGQVFQPFRNPVLPPLLQMNHLAAMDRSVYIKNLLGLPQTLGEILMAAQNKQNPLVNNNSLLLNSLNEELLKNQKIISEIFHDGETTALAQNIQAQTAIPRDAVMLFFSGMIHMPSISEMIQKNGKQAIQSLIISMASASKNGMTSEEIRETMKIINSCISMAEPNNPAQTLKSLMLLYLPWLPLNDGVGFDLEVSPQEGENESDNSKLTVLIQTKNFGNVKGEFTLTTSNSVDIFITCSEGFPKKILLESLKEESSSHAMNTNIDIEAVTPKKEEIAENRETKVNLSAANEMNPYLLLMAHAFIRNTVFIDSNSIVEEDLPSQS